MINVNNISKSFKLYNNPSDRLLEIFFGVRRHRELSALSNVSFNVDHGKALGIIGQNGAGKSTLLKLLTGVLIPDSGSIKVDGKITGLLELGTGFNHEFSGVENIYLNGTFLGLTKREIETTKESIIDFSELGEFIKEPLKSYSTGMIMRLAFSIAIHAKPKAFVIDEALSVGDVAFQQKCLNKINEFRNEGGSIVFVSHDLNAVKVLCDKALLLKKGAAIDYGDPDKVINSYNMLISKRSNALKSHSFGSSLSNTSYGNNKVTINNVSIFSNISEQNVIVTGSCCSICIDITANDDISDLTIGILFRDRLGQDVFGINTNQLKINIALYKNQNKSIKFSFDSFNIGPGKYTLTVAAHSLRNHITDCFHWIDAAKNIEVVTDGVYEFIGFSRLIPKVELS